jgi:hypothetical protein
MIANIDPVKSAVTSLISVLAGTSYNYINVTLANMALSTANTAFQHLAWTTAILAGIVSIINGVRKWKHNTKTKTDDNLD